jgi:copper chaperone CopZ
MMSDRRPHTIARIRIGGMSSVHAARAVFTALAGVDGVIKADVARGVAVVEHDGRVTEAALQDAVALAGFEVIAITDERRALPLL